MKVRLWRLVPERWAGTAFTGIGSRLAGGRWNSVGTPLVYLSSSLSLAALEVLVHADPEDLPDSYMACSIEVFTDRKHVEVVDPATLSPDWREELPPPELRDFGDTWVRDGRTLLLKLPSVIIPAERNYILNPAHPDFDPGAVLPPEPFQFDPRLYKP